MSVVRAIVTFLCISALTVIPALSLAKAQSGIFGSRETQYNDISAFSKWNSAVSRFHSQAIPGACKNPKGYDPACRMQIFNQFVKQHKGLAPEKLMIDVQELVNSYPYIPDIENWGVSDYWTAPGEFFSKGGNCKDYAIAKYFLLKELGFSKDSMRIVVLTDTNLHAIHAVLSVKYKNKTYILDNQISEIVTEEQIHHYVPIYSINENHWWLHRV